MYRLKINQLVVASRSEIKYNVLPVLFLSDANIHYNARHQITNNIEGYRVTTHRLIA